MTSYVYNKKSGDERVLSRVTFENCLVHFRVWLLESSPGCTVKFPLVIL